MLSYYREKLLVNHFFEFRGWNNSTVIFKSLSQTFSVSIKLHDSTHVFSLNIYILLSFHYSIQYQIKRLLLKIYLLFKNLFLFTKYVLCNKQNVGRLKTLSGVKSSNLK